MHLLVINIKLLVGIRSVNKLLRGQELSDLPSIENAFILIEHGRIVSFGNMYELELEVPNPPKDVYDAAGAIVLPAWCDSHTHLVFAAPRETEFVAKLKGATYAEIAASGGGILNSAQKLRHTSEDDLLLAALERINKLALLGTGAIEIKSGYGLSLEGELKMLRVIKKLKEISPVSIRSTFLGAHAFPSLFRNNHQGYLDIIINAMLPAIHAEKLADYIDVFCEEGFFSASETAQVCTAGARYGLMPKLHVNQLNSIGGIETGISNNAVSLDHLETLNDNEIKLLGGFAGCATLLPTAAFFLRMPFQPARKLIEAGAAVALASDFNPGSSPSGNMNFVAALSAIQMKLLPEEVINAATINGAYAMGLQGEVGSISIGKKANLIFTRPVSSLAYLFYAFGENHIDRVMLEGEWLKGK